MIENEQILKTRDDYSLINLIKMPDSDDGTSSFKLKEGCLGKVKSSDEPIKSSDLRPCIEPWLAALCQSEHLSLLIGSGLTQAIHCLATERPAVGMEPSKEWGSDDFVIKAANHSASVAGRSKANLEDQIRVANELLRGYEVLSCNDKKYNRKASDLREKLCEVVQKLSNDILQNERNIFSENKEKYEKSFGYLVRFLMSFASRTGTRDRLHLFTTNYDRLIEAGAEVAGMHLVDRFCGTLTPIFRSSRLNLDLHYNPPGIRGEPRYVEGVARFTKLHGSLDWINCGQDIRRLGVPFGAKAMNPFLEAAGFGAKDWAQLMVYPSEAKDRETSAYPYVELFRDFAAAICRPNHTLVAFGYGFGDEHVNRVIKDMLTIPSTHLVAVSRSDPHDRIMEIYNNLGRESQISLLVGNHIGDFRTLVDYYLPKPAIDRATFRMNELLKARLGPGERSGKNNADDCDDEKTIDK